MRTRSRLLALAAAVLVVPTAFASTQGAQAAPARKVLWLVMENHSYNQIVGKPGVAPYINNSLLPLGGSATNMHSETHPSLPNYIAMTTGSTHGIADDANPSKHPITGGSIFSQATTWTSYQDAMPSNCYKKMSVFSGGTQYVPKHNPAIYMADAPVGGVGGECGDDDRPLATATLDNLGTDLAGGTLPSFSFVTPGICHDMHKPPTGESCTPTNPITAGDAWLSVWMPKVFASPDYTSGALVVFVTWDEGSGGSGVKGMDCLASANLTDNGCHIPTLVFSATTTGGSRSGVFFSHYSMLKTTEELLGLPTDALGANVIGANSMRSAFNL